MIRIQNEIMILVMNSGNKTGHKGESSSVKKCCVPVSDVVMHIDLKNTTKAVYVSH